LTRARFGSGSDLARLLGISRQAVHQAVKSGRITRSDNGQFDLDAAAIQYRMHTDPDQSRRGLAKQRVPAEPAPAAGAVPPVEDWRSRQARADALTAELNLQKLSGELVERSEVERELGRRLAAMQVQFDALPDRAAAALGMTDEHRRKVRQFLRDELAQIRLEAVRIGGLVAA
jgi:hypothetical protein